MKKDIGFTIVELLVVIVVTAILAAITIVSYTNVTNRAQLAQIQSSIKNIQNTIDSFNVINEAYPASIADCPSPAPANICIAPPSGSVFRYNQSVSGADGIYAAKEITKSYGLGILGPSRFLYTSAAEITSSNGDGWKEFMQYMDMAPYIDKYGLVKYQISFDIKSADTSAQSTIRVYLQNGSESKYSFDINIPVTTTYTHQTIVVTPGAGYGSTNQAILAFYGVYGSGNIPTVKNVQIQLAQ